MAVAECKELCSAWCCCLPDIAAFFDGETNRKSVPGQLGPMCVRACRRPLALCLSHPSAGGLAGRRVLRVSTVCSKACVR